MRFFSSPRIVCTLLLLLVGVNGCLRADSLPYAAADIFGFSGDFCNQTDASSASCAYNGATAYAIVNNGTGGAASASTGSTLLGADGIVAYTLEIVGPVGVSVPVIISGTATVLSGSNLSAEQILASGFAKYTVFYGTSFGVQALDETFSSPAYCQIDSAFGIQCTPSGSFSLPDTLDSDTIFGVVLQAAATEPNSSASIDPTITIDPSFPQASQFSVVASPGVFTASPEPPSLSLCLIGAGVLALGLFARKVRKGLSRDKPPAGICC